MTNLGCLGEVFLEKWPLLSSETVKNRTSDTDHHFLGLLAAFTDRGVLGLDHLVFFEVGMLYFVETVQTILRHGTHLIYLVLPMIHMIQCKGNALIEQFVPADSDIAGEVIHFVQQIHINPHRNHVLFDFLRFFRNKICHVANLPEMIQLL